MTISITADWRQPIGGALKYRAAPQRVHVRDEEYGELRRRVQAAGLINRAYVYYAARSALTLSFWAMALALMLTLPSSWGWSLLAAACFGFASVQVSMLGHDAGHLGIFKSPRANFAAGQFTMTLLLGVSFWYWCNRHNLHHSHTNDVEVDPDIQGGGLLIYTDRQAAAARGWHRVVARHQGRLSPVFLLGLFLIIFWIKLESWTFVFKRLCGARRQAEIALLLTNLGLMLLPAWLQGWHWLHLWLVGQMLGSLYFSMIVATNHKGMPIWARGAPLSFIERQVLSSRNVTSHPVWDFLFGGLNYQIEHHLFPTMPRVNLKRARAIIRPFCLAHGLEYEELNPLASYRVILAEAERVGRLAD
jgi:fatty acid desaturase